MIVSLDTVRLNAALNLPPLQRRPICHGYQNCCVCRDCRKRARSSHQADPQPRQPWELKAA